MNRTFWGWLALFATAVFLSGSLIGWTLAQWSHRRFVPEGSPRYLVRLREALGLRADQERRILRILDAWRQRAQAIQARYLRWRGEELQKMQEELWESRHQAWQQILTILDPEQRRRCERLGRPVGLEEP